MLSKYSWPTNSTQFSTLFLFSEIIIIHQEYNNYKWLKRVGDDGWRWCRAVGRGRVGDAFTLTEVQSIISLLTALYISTCSSSPVTSTFRHYFHPCSLDPSSFFAKRCIVWLPASPLARCSQALSLPRK